MAKGVELSKIHIGPYSFDPPESLVDLLRDMEVKKPEEGELDLPEGYEREVVMRDGKVYTILRPKEN